jgi:ADP-dependent NAD(P)H-hydrate dehydratase / NAD(P)H-hydrate epimerase
LPRKPALQKQRLPSAELTRLFTYDELTMSLIRLNRNTSYPLHSAAVTRRIEQAAAAQLAPHTLMQRAGLAVARLTCALAPHAQTIWVACGSGNNGGDGLEAAMHLKQWGRNPVVTWLGDESRCPADALLSLQRARQASVTFADEAPVDYDFAVDALLGIGQIKPVVGVMADWLRHMQQTAPAVLCVDVPSGLNTDTGTYSAATVIPEIAIKNIAVEAINTPAKVKNIPIFCLSLLTLKPGLFTAYGKDAAGEVWFDDLGLDAEIDNTTPPTAWLLGADRARLPARLHASHKGTFGDVVVVGGAAGMTGAALLAARAALHAGAGRVYVALLDTNTVNQADQADQCMTVDPMQPELMFRQLETLPLREQTVVCGCGGGDAVRHVLPQVLSQAPRLVLDADALNAVSVDTSLQTLLITRSKRSLQTILTPHPLEAARLLGVSVAQVQADRLNAAQTLADRFGCVVILKGAGSVIAALGQVPFINASGNAKLATAGTGDVLAGMVGALLAASQDAFQSACIAVYRHGRSADNWPAGSTLTASELVKLM